MECCKKLTARFIIEDLGRVYVCVSRKAFRIEIPTENDFRCLQRVDWKNEFNLI